MTDAFDFIDPRPVWPTAQNPFETAAEAFESGNYPIALDLADEGGEIHACAMVMCGAIAPGLELLRKFESPRARLIRAYAHWCLIQTDEALSLLREIQHTELGPAAEKFLGLLENPIDVVVLSMPDPSRKQPYSEIAGIQIHWIQLDAEQFGTTMHDALAKALPLGVRPQLLLSLDAYGPYLPDDPNGPGIPLVFWASDHDYFFSTRHADLARADLIVANSAAEQAEMARHYAGRCVAFPGHETYRPQKAPSTEKARDVDILFTGRAFVPYMRDKAQFLFRIAALDSPTLSIDITDGYLSDEAYVEALARAKFVPIFWRSAGGLQTRAIEALRAGASVLSPERSIVRPLLGDAAALYRSAVQADIATVVSEQRPNNRAVSRDLDKLFWPSPAREERFVKFCLFQSALMKTRTAREPLRSYYPVELRGYDVPTGIKVYTRLARLNGGAEVPDAPHYLHAAASAFYAAILLSNTPSAGQNVAQMALDFYRTGIEAHPQSLALRFNGARALWTFGQRAEALEQFRAIVERLPDLAFDARTDALLSHRIRILADMFPYGDFFRAAVDQHQGHGRGPGARDFVASTALTYISSDLIERGEWASSIGILQRALERCGVNVAGWRLMTRALAHSGASAATVRQAFYRAVNLYPPELFELLPIGIEAELADGRRAEASDILRHWTLARARVHDLAGSPPAVSNAVLQAAQSHRDLLTDWTGALFDRIVGQDQKTGI